ncbi:MAG: prepilin-type N-terminal cleavage/methylation domain-containing protein [Nitrospirae bacterium]|nr:prepilin-type N-terminal cleavage/methylation domain-containing protein [Nitrospirota bacterium]
MNKKGFTLIELLITIAIIGILAGVATTAYVGSIKKAARSEAYSNLENLRILEESFYADNGDYAPLAGGTLTGTAAIAGALPGFVPGPSTNYVYSLIKNNVITDNSKNRVDDPPTWAAQATPPCFVATAVAIAGTRVENDEFVIDCNNNKNF